MEYSSDDIAAATSLEFATYIYVSTATFWTYDYVCSLHEEWTFLLQSHWSKVKVLYVVTRYLPFIFLITDLYPSFIANKSPSECRVLNNIDIGLGIASAAFSECFFILRTYALWNNNRIVLAVMISTFFTFSVASIGVTFSGTVPAAYATSAIPGTTGCYQRSSSLLYFIPFLLFSTFHVGLIILTLIRAIQSCRKRPSPLYVVLVNHNISYFTCGLLFSITNIFTPLLLKYSYGVTFYNFQFMILAILATRMHLHLWRMNRHAYSSGALVHITMSDMTYANPTT